MKKVNKWIYSLEVQAKYNAGEYGWEYVATVGEDGPESELVKDARLAYGPGFSIRVVSRREINPEWETQQ